MGADDWQNYTTKNQKAIQEQINKLTASILENQKNFATPKLLSPRVGFKVLPKPVPPPSVPEDAVTTNFSGFGQEEE